MPARILDLNDSTYLLTLLRVSPERSQIALQAMVRCTPGTKLLFPLPQLLPRLNELLHGPCCGECAAVNDSTIPVRTLVKVEHRVRTQAREVLAKLFQILTTEHIFGFVELWPPSHERSW